MESEMSIFSKPVWVTRRGWGWGIGGVVLISMAVGFPIFAFLSNPQMAWNFRLVIFEEIGVISVPFCILGTTLSAVFVEICKN